ncbi:porphobilinogen deaminase [Geofilum rubicundum JCM 15548]|uniref:Hydroxymethylbilane synthase n=1 Tax=Geofilum rubicundum JCM 15548 TaxID=1236989 RepID=A0A0E9M295_9BACT|nr:porphobilinogen deaminase [Geofilum rubicundum JCM 15548]
MVIKTKGDKILDVALSKIGDKGLFTKEIEQALLAGEIDLAVHSLKDMPTELPEGLSLGGVLPRGEIRDVFLSRDGRKLSAFTGNDKVGTSSLRRKSQLLNHFPYLDIVDIRGNVNSRIQKMQEGYCDGLIMAGAGIQRLGLEDLVSEYLDPTVIMPAVSQGAITIEVREDDEDIMPYIDGINDDLTWTMVMAERAFLRTMEGGCQVPVACRTLLVDDRLKISALVAALDGSQLVRETIECDLDEASEKAVEMALRMLEAGAADILKSIRYPDA